MKRFTTCAHLMFSLPKTVWFNLHYLGWRAVWRLPVVVSHRVVLKKMGGRVRVEGAWQRAMIRIGFGDVAVFDRRRSQTVWHNLGLVVFCGRAILNHGSRLSVEAKGVLSLGDAFHINAETTLICRKGITFGRDCLLSWHVLVMDSDQSRCGHHRGRSCVDRLPRLDRQGQPHRIPLRGGGAVGGQRNV